MQARDTGAARFNRRGRGGLGRSGSMLSAAAAAAIVVGGITLPQVALGQTSSTWAVDVGTTGGNWSNPANWVGGVVPDNGGTATFTTLPFTTAPLNIIQDQPNVTVSGLNFNSFITYLLRAPTLATPDTITLSGPAAINTNTQSINTLNTTVFGQLMQISLTGSSGLTKNGPGTVSLWATNTYSGGTTINAGIVVARQFGDLVFGSASAPINLNDGTIRVTTSAWTSSRTINLGGGGGTIEATTTGTTTFNGPVTGGAGATLNKAGSRGLILTAANTYSGATNVLAGSFALSGNGTALNTSSLTSRDTVVLDNTTTNINDRLNDAAPVTLQGSAFTLTGNAGTPTNETIGNTTFSRGTSLITVAPNAATGATLNMGNVGRDTGGTAFFRADNLGYAVPAQVGFVRFNTAPTLVGGGGGTNSTTVSIIPWAYGITSSAGTLNSATASFVTYGQQGVRPLDTTNEYASAIPVGAGNANNVRLIGATSVGAASSANSLILAGAASYTVGGSGTVTIGSGALLNLVNGNTFSAPIDFGSAEGIVFAPASITFSGTIAGSGGLTKQGPGVATFANAANTYTGTTIIGGGTATFLNNVPSGAPSPFGNSTSAVVLAPAGLGTGGTTARLIYAGAGTGVFSRDLLVSGRIALNNSATLPGVGAAAGSGLALNGNITLDGSPLTFTGTSTSTVVVNGNITGAGPITDAGGAGSIILNGSNNFTEGAEMSGSTWVIGSSSALGTGGLLKMVQLSGSPTIIAAGGPRTVANPAVSFSFSTSYWTIAGSNDITFTGSINLSGSYNHVINNAGKTTYAGVLHTGGFTKTGTGVLSLTGSNIYTGTTTVSAGTLLVDNLTGSGTGSGPVNVSSGATLGGVGTIAGPVSVANGGTLAPGDSPGTLATGPLTLNGTSSLLYELNTPNVVDMGVNDLLVVNGNLTLDGVLTVVPGVSYGPGTYTLMTYTGSLTDNGLSVNPTPYPTSIDTSTPGQVKLVVSVPEPATAGLLALTAVVAGIRRRRR